MALKKMASFTALTFILAMITAGCTTASENTGTTTNETEAAAPEASQTSQEGTTDGGPDSGGSGGGGGGMGAIDKSADTELQEILDEVEGKYEQLVFEDEATGKTLAYNLYVPENYDASQAYPLVLFMHDMSISGGEAADALEQGYGGVIWATEEEQAKHPSFVLVPVYSETIVNDNFETTDEVEMTVRLIEQLEEQYNIDESRLYTTGQSMGGMTSIYLNIAHPDLFAASLFVASQWDTTVMDVLADKNIFYIVAEGDPKASAGMEDFEAVLAESNVTPSTATWDATWDADTLNQATADLLEEGNNLNFVMWELGTVLPEGVEVGTTEHMYSFDYAYKVEAVRDWLFAQVK